MCLSLLHQYKFRYWHCACLKQPVVRIIRVTRTGVNTKAAFITSDQNVQSSQSRQLMVVPDNVKWIQITSRLRLTTQRIIVNTWLTIATIFVCKILLSISNDFSEDMWMLTLQRSRLNREHCVLTHTCHLPACSLLIVHDCLMSHPSGLSL